MEGLPPAISRNTFCSALHFLVAVHAQTGADMFPVCRGLHGSAVFPPVVKLQT